MRGARKENLQVILELSEFIDIMARETKTKTNKQIK